MAVGQLPSRLRLGKIGFLNVLPIYYPLESGIIPHSFTIVSGSPAHLNELMARGELDVSVVSSIEYARHPESYFLLPDLSISCCGPVGSVLLLSRVPFHKLSGGTVMVTKQSHTSVALLEILFSLRMGIEADFQAGSASEAINCGEFPTAFLTIGDEALRLRDHELYPYRLDLGEAWHQWTGLPFVFATWVVQRKAVERWNGQLDALMGVLFSAKKWGSANLDIICRDAAERGPLSREQLCQYYSGLGFNLGREEQKGLECFYGYLQQIGEIRSTPATEVYTPLESVA